MNLVACQFFEFSLTSGDPRDIVRSALATSAVSLVNTINANAFNVSLVDRDFHGAMMASEFLVADGIGVVWAGKLLGAKGLGKISGFDLFMAAIDIANEEQLTVGFLGSTPEVLDMITSKSAVDYPGAVVKVLSPPFASSFSDEEAVGLVDELGPVDILFVGMTAPKQEKFAYQIKDGTSARVVMSIGAVFDFYAGTTKRAHPVLIRMGLELLGRSLADPKRLGKRNLIAIPTFIVNCIKQSAKRN